MENQLKQETTKVWKTPELIILVRNKPEDAILGTTSCKGTARTETIMMNSGCLTYGPCAACFTLSSS